MAIVAPLAYFLQTILTSPYSGAAKKEEISIENYAEKSIDNQLESQSKRLKVDESTENCEDLDIKSVLKEAFTSSTFIMITLGFTVCGFHVTFLATHFPAYLVNIIACFSLYNHRRKKEQHLLT